ncbi:hypothetical protein ON010_g10344 [Phytophthora cinnamomi]|nr:hypothetical protein ON010_g10344 [Phytophthora cinnamomi]
MDEAVIEHEVEPWTPSVQPNPLSSAFPNSLRFAEVIFQVPRPPDLRRLPQPTMKVIPSVLALGAFVAALVFSPEAVRVPPGLPLPGPREVDERPVRAVLRPGHWPVSHVLPAQPELDDLGQHDLGSRRVQGPGHLGGLPKRAPSVRGQVG